MRQGKRSASTRRDFLCSVARAAATLSVSGSFLCSGSGIDVPRLGSIKLRRSEQIGASPWGIWASYGPLPGHDPEADRGIGITTKDTVDVAIELVSELGAKSAHVGMNWRSAEPSKGKYDFGMFDRILLGLKKRTVEPIVQLYGSSNPAYGMDAGMPASAVVNEPLYLKAWANCVAAAVESSRTSAKHFEIWNEPNMEGYWLKPDPTQYAQIVGPVARAVKSANPGATVLAGSVAMVRTRYQRNPMDFIRGFLFADQSPDWDAFSYHPYGEFPEGSVGAVLELSSWLKQHRGRNVPIFQTECGYPSTGDSDGFQGPGPWGEIVQGKWLLRRLLTDLSVGARLATYFMLYDTAGPTIKEGPKKGQRSVNTKGLVTLEGTRKRAFRVYQHLTALIDSSYSLSPGEIKFPAVALGGYSEMSGTTDTWPAFTKDPHQSRDAFVEWRNGAVKALQFQRQDGVRLCCYWLPVLLSESEGDGAAMTAEFPANYFNDPVLVNLLTGSVHDLSSKARRQTNIRFEDLPLRDYPLVIAERTAVHFE